MRRPEQVLEMFVRGCEHIEKGGNPTDCQRCTLLAIREIVAPFAQAADTFRKIATKNNISGLTNPTPELIAARYLLFDYFKER